MTTWADITIVGNTTVRVAGNPDGYPDFVIPFLRKALSKTHSTNPQTFINILNRLVKLRYDVSNKAFGLKQTHDRPWIHNITYEYADYSYVVNLNKRKIYFDGVEVAR